MKNISPRRTATLAAVVCLALTTAACGGGGFEEPGTDTETSAEGPAALDILIGSSGTAETDAVTAAATAWAEESGNTATVTAANDLVQQLSQGFAANTPPDVFYVSADQFAAYAQNGSIEPYAADLENADDFYPALVETFTYEDEFYCAPKDFSNLALVINDTAWAEAGLTADDVPTTWEELSTVAAALTTGERKGLVTSTEFQRLGAFMTQAGGGLVTDGKATATSDENLEGLEFVQQMLADGSMAFTTDVGAGWGGEAFGTGAAAMTIEGNWILGALEADYPDVDWSVASLPEGPGGPGTLTFTNCWGIAAASENKAAAKELVQFLTSAERQLAFSDAFGVMPSVQSAAEDWRTANPDVVAFLDQADNAVAPPNQVGVAEVIADMNAQLESLNGGDAEAILASTQTNLEAALGSGS